jgi:UDP-N-acetylmuramate--alanine ligase
MTSPQHIHLIGIGGAGLSAIATVLLEQGYTVSGSDLRASPVTERLARLGAMVHVGHAATNLGDVDLVVVSSAVPAGNPEVEEAQRRDIPVVKRAEWLGRMMAGKRGVAVAGTHGKTTTTAMIALILREAGLDPTFIVGGDIPQLGTNAAAGTGDVFVIEADEYDHTFLGLRPEIAVVTVVEWDHPDCYPTPESMMEAFQQFVALVPPEGLVVGCGDESGVQELFGKLVNWEVGRLADWETGKLGDWEIGKSEDQSAEDLPSPPQFPNPSISQSTNLPTTNLPITQSPNLPALITYGLNAGNDWRAVELELNMHGGYDFAVHLAHALKPAEERLGQVSLGVPGTHNVKNALAALAVADWLGVPFAQAADTLANFSGVGRRFEIKGQTGGIVVVDDYAHHPTEIRATLAAARTRYPERAIWAVFQPHTYSRTRALLDDFAAAFADADHVVVVDIFPAREVDDGSVSSRDIVARMEHPDTYYIGSLEDAASFLVDRLRPGDMLITLGAGDGYRVGEMVTSSLDDPKAPDVDSLAKALRARFGRRLRRDEALAAHTTLRVGGPADLWLTVTALDELVESVTLAREHNVPVLLLGGGANMLVSDRGVRGLVVQNRCQQVTFPRKPAPPARAGAAQIDAISDPPRVIVESGAILPSLAHRLARRGLSGLEWAVGVPGTIGGAVVNNAGAYGSSIADCLVRAELLMPAGYQGGNGRRQWHSRQWHSRQWRSVNWFEYEYRSSRLKRPGAKGKQEQFVVLQVELALSRKSPAEIENQMAAYSERRRATQPPGASIGSMFKNPPGDYAGRLVDAAGLKGTQIGGAQISPVHANFFVNQGDAKAADFAALIELARQTVKARFNVELELEIEKIGDWEVE